MSMKTLISSALPFAHCTVSSRGPVPVLGVVIHAGVAATGLGKLCCCQSSLLLSLFLRHTTLFLVLDLSQPQELWFTLGVTATLLLSPFLSHKTLFLVNLSQRRSCGSRLESLLHCCFLPFSGTQCYSWSCPSPRRCCSRLESQLQCCFLPFSGTQRYSWSWICPSRRSCGSRWSRCYRQPSHEGRPSSPT